LRVKRKKITGPSLLPSSYLRRTQVGRHFRGVTDPLPMPVEASKATHIWVTAREYTPIGSNGQPTIYQDKSDYLGDGCRFCMSVLGNSAVSLSPRHCDINVAFMRAMYRLLCVRWYSSLLTITPRVYIEENTWDRYSQSIYLFFEMLKRWKRYLARLVLPQPQRQRRWLFINMSIQNSVFIRYTAATPPCATQKGCTLPRVYIGLCPIMATRWWSASSKTSVRELRPLRQ